MKSISSVVKRHKFIIRLSLVLVALTLIVSALATEVILSQPQPQQIITQNKCTKTIINPANNATVIGFSPTAFNTTYSTGTITLETIISSNSTIHYIGCK